MSSLLNSIFFIKKEHLNINNVLNVLRSFMFTSMNHAAIMLRSNNYIKDSPIENIEYVVISDPDVPVSSETISVPVDVTNKIVESVPRCKDDLISPKQADTLFWCLYIIQFGYSEYLEVDRNYGVKELELKKHIGEYITKNSHAMKNTNIKFTKAAVQEVLSELLTSQKETSINSLMALLVCYKFIERP